MDELKDDLGPSVPSMPVKPNSKISKALATIAPEIVEEYKNKVAIALATCTTHRDVLKVELDSLAECAALAAEIFKNNPSLDNAYQVSTLTTAHNTTLNQYEKLKDPTSILFEIETLFRRFFQEIVRNLILEIDKVKRTLVDARPEDKSTIEDLFSRLFDSVQPNTEALYKEIHDSLKKTLGIKK